LWIADSDLRRPPLSQHGGSGRGAIRVPRYCAEHRHEIPGFEKVRRQEWARSADYRDFLEYDEPNLSRTTKLAGASLLGWRWGSCCPASQRQPSEVL
jgi:hypothetical protein